MFPRRFFWNSEAAQDLATNGLHFHAVRRANAYDSYVASQSLDLTPPASQATLIPDMEWGLGYDRLKVHRRRKRQQIIQILSENQDYLIALAAPDPDPAIYIIARDDNEESRRLHWKRRRSMLASRIGGDTLQPAPFVPATVWSITPEEILNEIQYHLLEPVIDGGQTWQFWTYDEVRRYLVERVGQFLNATNIVKVRGILDLTASTSTYAMDPALAALQRVYFPNEGGLSRTTEWALDGMRSTWENDQAGTPDSFLENADKTVRLIPAPGSSGEASYVYVSSVATEGQQDFLFQTLTIPATFSWGLKYAIMADMLSREGEGNDPTRAAYCEQRFSDAVELAKIMMGGELAAR